MYVGLWYSQKFTQNVFMSVLIEEGLNVSSLTAVMITAFVVFAVRVE